MTAAMLYVPRPPIAPLTPVVVFGTLPALVLAVLDGGTRYDVRYEAAGIGLVVERVVTAEQVRMIDAGAQS